MERYERCSAIIPAENYLKIWVIIEEEDKN